MPIQKCVKCYSKDYEDKPVRVIPIITATAIPMLIEILLLSILDTLINRTSRTYYKKRARQQS